MSINKIIIALLASLVLFAPFILMDDADASNDAIIKVSSVEADAGEDVIVSIALESNPGIWSITANLSYDSALSIKSIDSKANDLNLAKGKLTKNPYKIYMDRSDIADSTEVGVIIDVTFTVSETATPGNYPVKILKDGDFLVINSSGNEVTTSIVDGAITVPKYGVTYVDEHVDAPATGEYVNGATFNLPAHGAVIGYDFLGWSDGDNLYQPGDSYTVNGSDVEFTAQYQIKKYTVKFQNHDGSILQESQSEYGTVIEYKGDAPVKASTAKYSYTFAG